MTARAAVIDRARIRHDLAPDTREFAAREDALEPLVRFRGPRLVVGDFYRSENLRPAHAFSRLFGRRHGLGAWVHAVWNDLPTAGFNGVIFDDEGRIVANAKFAEMRLHAPYVFDLKTSILIDKINRYHRPEAWIEYVLRLVRADHGVGRKDESRPHQPVSPQYLETYFDYVATTRRMMEFFAIGSARQGWLVLNLDRIMPDEGDLELLRRKIQASPGVSGAILLTATRIVTVTAERITTERLGLCEFGLSRVTPTRQSLEADARRNAPVSTR